MQRYTFKNTINKKKNNKNKEKQKTGNKMADLSPNVSVINGFKNQLRGSLVVQWLRIHLPMQGTLVRALVQEDPTCCGAMKPMRHS